MPILQIYTTLVRSKIPVKFASNAAILLSKVLNKPLKAMTVHIDPDQLIYSGNDPNGTKQTAFATLRNIGDLNADQNRKTTEELSKLIDKELGIKSTEFKIVFIELNAQSFGLKGQLRTDFKDI